MKTFTRLYLALCLLALGVFAWAEHTGHVLFGDAGTSTASQNPSQRAHHK